MTGSRCFALLLITLLLLTPRAAHAAGLPGGDALWFNAGPDEAPAVRLYFFWSSRCAHCLEAKPHVEALAERHAWLELHAFQVYDEPQNLRRFLQMAALLGRQPTSVPTFMLCGEMYVGWAGAASGSRFLEQRLEACYAAAYGGRRGAPEPAAAAPPMPGGLGLEGLSLPLVTVVLAAMDAFNPCAFFVLLFLLSMLVHTRSRRTMLIVGTLYLSVSGLVYFAFMAAWLNAFLMFGELRAVTLAAGVVAVATGLINIKDYFWYRRGVSLSMSASQRQTLFRRSRALLASGNLTALLAATAVLALVANLYELLCTAGFPMLYTRILTLNDVPPAGYYLYLLLYNAVYVTPLLLIVLLFALTLGSRKLSESEGRFLKLASGLMMLALGVLLVMAPERLGSPLTAAGLLVAALALAALIAALKRTAPSADRPR